MTQVAVPAALDLGHIEGEQISCRHLVLRSLQWRRVRDIDDRKPIDDTDADCLNEIRDVLDRHGCLERFGVALLDRHFQLCADEIMLETTDVIRREHWVRPVKREDLRRQGVQSRTTVICFDETGYLQQCKCLVDNDAHTQRHG